MSEQVAPNIDEPKSNPWLLKFLGVIIMFVSILALLMLYSWSGGKVVYDGDSVQVEHYYELRYIGIAVSLIGLLIGSIWTAVGVLIDELRSHSVAGVKHAALPSLTEQLQELRAHTER
ncbi:hypothetical protein [Chitinilyticum piscinae]|uniref:Uncharacterized protein n=1 Tax=Chitinilyticum piscinae TaxID=2866724 RepID=A0A8J7FHI6_9NEIS|nr:hypothetical protein [Chitinilyticum piscinae]MBE9607862.1 hypothetical protein [Chitinilyticum piscinae]